MSDDFIRDFGTELDRAAKRLADGDETARERVRHSEIISRGRQHGPTLTALIVVAAIAGTIAVAARGGSNAEREADPSPAGDTSPTPADPTRQAPTESVDSRIEANYAVFRREGRDSDIARSITGMKTSPFGANGELARAVRHTSGTVVYAVPGNASLCMVVQEAEHRLGGGCAEADAIISDGTMYSTGSGLDDNERRIYGLMPDWVDSVVFATGAGDETAAAIVEDNAFDAVVSSSTRRATLIGQDHQAVEVIAPNP